MRPFAWGILGLRPGLEQMTEWTHARRVREDVPVSPSRVVIRCAKRGEHTTGPGEHIINVSSTACEEAEIDMPLDISSVRRAPHMEWLNPLWEAIDEITSWVTASGSVVILCDTGADTSRLVASIVSSILKGCGANVTTCPPPESDAAWLTEMYHISQNFIGIDNMEEELFWVLNGEPFGIGVNIYGAEY